MCAAWDWWTRGGGPQGRDRTPRQDDAFRSRRKVGRGGGSSVSQDAVACSQAPLPTHGSHTGPCGFRKEEAQAAVGAQLCALPAPSRLPDGLRALGPWKKPGRPLPARLGRAAPHSFLMRHGGATADIAFPGFHGTPWTGQGSAGRSANIPHARLHCSKHMHQMAWAALA